MSPGNTRRTGRSAPPATRPPGTPAPPPPSASTPGHPPSPPFPGAAPPPPSSTLEIVARVGCAAPGVTNQAALDFGNRNVLTYNGGPNIKGAKISNSTTTGGLFLDLTDATEPKAHVEASLWTDVFDATPPTI